MKEIKRANLALLSLRIESYICVKTQFCLSGAVQKTRPLHAGPVLISGSLWPVGHESKDQAGY